jgi:hypothetical protein
MNGPGSVRKLGRDRKLDRYRFSRNIDLSNQIVLRNKKCLMKHWPQYSFIKELICLFRQMAVGGCAFRNCLQKSGCAFLNCLQKKGVMKVLWLTFEVGPWLETASEPHTFPLQGNSAMRQDLGRLRMFAPTFTTTAR